MYKIIHPIHFTIHSSKIVEEIPTKTKLLSTIIPGNTHAYTFDTEEDYYKEYQTSMFAITRKKGGWDCMRHYEILANGCIPYFEKMEDCPKNTMTTFPFQLVKEAMVLYDKMKLEDNPLENKANVDKYHFYINLLLEHTRKYLTNEAIVKHILEKSGHKDAKKILFLSYDIKPDYLRCVTLTGFKDYFKENCHDIPRIDHIYKDYRANLHDLYGRGITYTKIVCPSYRNDELDKTILEDIKNHKYDIVIYGSFHRGLIFYNEVQMAYKPNEIIILCGEDEGCHHYCCRNNNTVFLREHIF